MEEKQEKEGFILVAHPEKRVPKLCTQVLFGLGSDGKIILTFVYKDGPDDKGVVIERIMLPDNKQAKQIVEKLTEVIDQSEEIIKGLSSK